MYPSPQNVRYGIFVKNFENAVKHEFNVVKVVLTKKNGFFSKLLGYFSLYIRTIIALFRADKHDIIYVHFPLHLAPILWFLSFLNRKIVLNFHGSDLIFDTAFKKLLGGFLKPLMNNNNLVVPSNYYKGKIAENFQSDPSRIFVYPSGGIDTKVFYPNGVEKTAVFTLGFVSNFIKEKGWEVFLEAMSQIQDQNLIPLFEMEIVGDGPDTVKLKNYLKQHNLEAKITSNLLHQDLAKVYNNLDVFIFPSFREAESLGLVGLEAMACGVPVIASKVGGPMGYIEDGVNGFLFEKRDVKMLREKIVEFYFKKEDEKLMLRENALNTAKQYDSITVNKTLLTYLVKL
jgi:glycosyltransferase involved in cell wall biosynthesis